MKKIILLIGIMALFSVSCKTLQPLTHNQAAIDQVAAVAAAVNTLYDTQINGTDKSYAGNASNYDNAETEAANLKAIDASRPKALALDDFIIKRLIKYRQDHQTAGSFNNSQILTRKDQMESLLKSRALAEP